MNAKSITALSAVTFLSLACAVRPDSTNTNTHQATPIENPSVPAPAEAHVAEVTPQPIVPPPLTPTLAVVPNEQPGSYLVRISWPTAPEGTAFWQIDRMGTHGTRERIAQVPASDSSFDDTKATEGESYTYFLRAVTAEQAASPASVPLFEKELTAALPHDLVVDGNFVASDLLGIGRLFLKKNAAIISNGKPINIEAQEIISDEGSILTQKPTLIGSGYVKMPEFCGAPAAIAQNGADGPPIRIRAQRARGFLYVKGCGQSGGMGAPGADGSPGLIGLPGAPAEWQWDADASGSILFAGDKYKRCTRNPTNGGAGYKGGSAGPGGAGASGGNGSPIDIVIAEVPEKDKFYLVATSDPGHGGYGGFPGKAGIGGPGGAAGAMDNDVRGCVAAQAGPQGSSGESAARGPAGPRGKAFEVSVAIGDTQLPKASSVSWPENAPNSGTNK